ncbi:hypothetical protein ACFL2B_01660 [Patescibacteria group bacterium]
MKPQKKHSILNELEKANIPMLEIVGNFINQAGYGINQKRRMYSDISTVDAYQLAENKDVSKKFLAENNIPVPKGQAIETVKELAVAFPTLTCPLVIKPTDSMWGYGVTTDISNFSQAKKAFENAKQQKKINVDKVIIEEQVSGNDYRVLVLNNRVIAAMHRIPARVKGDGKLTVKQLANRENKQRQQRISVNKESPKPIELDNTSKIILTKQGFSYDYIPKKGQYVTLRMNANIHTGGEGIDVTDNIHPANKDMCCRIARITGLEIVGIDILSPHISKPIGEVGGKITEINSNPDIDMHIMPHHGKPINTAKMFVDYLFPNPAKAWIPIKIKGKICKNQKLVNKYLKTKPKKVVQLADFGAKKKVIVKSPPEILLTYLLDLLTTSVEM